jgi:hypothetical protein
MTHPYRNGELRKNLTMNPTKEGRTTKGTKDTKEEAKDYKQRFGLLPLHLPPSSLLIPNCAKRTSNSKFENLGISIQKPLKLFII